MNPAIRLSLMLVVVTSLASAQSPAPDKAPPKFVGNTVCKTCHPDVSLNFYKNPHYKNSAGCEGCHGPGGAHVESHGNKTLIRAYSLMSPPQVLNACLTCHSRDMPRANIRRSSHTEADVVCTSCHSIHKSAVPKFLLAKVQRDLCYTCHTTVRAQFEMPSKHRVNEGTIQCTDCHNPHGTFAATWRMGSRPMVNQALNNEEPCLGCHSDKRGPFTFEHASVRVDGCETCHSAHGSPNARLLRRPVVFTLCLECHNGAGTFGRRNDGVPLQTPSHNLLDPRYQRCTVCHVRIHGSNSNQYFLR